jgi:hypothetical protein
MVVAEPAEVEVEQLCPEEWGDVRREGEENTQQRKQAVTAMISNQQRVCAAAGIPRGGSSNQGERRAGRKSECRGEWRAPDLRGGSVNLQKGCQGGYDS